MANTYDSVNISAPAGSGSIPYQKNIIVGDWVLNGSNYEIDILATTHLKGTKVIVQVFELITGQYNEVSVDINMSNIGDIKISIIASPDLRFGGKIIVVGE